MVHTQAMGMTRKDLIQCQIMMNSLINQWMLISKIKLEIIVSYKVIWTKNLLHLNILIKQGGGNQKAQIAYFNARPKSRFLMMGQVPYRINLHHYC